MTTTRPEYFDQSLSVGPNSGLLGDWAEKLISFAARTLLVLTSFAPVLFTFAFAILIKDDNQQLAAGIALIGLSLALAALALLRAAKDNLEIQTLEITSLRTVDREIIGFVLAYLLPLAIGDAPTEIDWRVVCFVIGIFFFVVIGTHSYQFNPLLGLFGWHFYEITTNAGITYVLLTRKDLRRTKTIGYVVQIGDYLLLEASPTK